MVNRVLTAILVAGMGIVPAHAQDVVDFSGAKIGAIVGYDQVRLGYGGEHESKDGFLYGLTVGYDASIGAGIVGIEGEFSDATTKDSATDLAGLGERWKLSAGRDLYIGARLGFPVNPAVLLYTKAGYTNARAKLSVSYEGDTASESDTLDGYRIGGGAEFSNGGHFARIEYRYSDYGNYEYKGFDTGIGASRHQVAVTGGFRF
ncbi:MAG: outer membrane protein [Sphingobium sp.]